MRGTVLRSPRFAGITILASISIFADGLSNARAGRDRRRGGRTFW